MALNPSTNVTMSGRIAAPSLEYPYGSAIDATPGENNGTPYFFGRADDIFGLQQSLLSMCGIVPTGNADNVVLSQYLQGIIEIGSGRGQTYDETGIANAYVLSLFPNQKTINSLFEGLQITFSPSFSTTGASTVDVSAILGQAPGTTLIDIRDHANIPTIENTLIQGRYYTLSYVASSSVFRKTMIEPFATGIEVDSSGWNIISGFSVQSTLDDIDDELGKVMGDGQSWQNVSGSRIKGVTYMNTTGRPIMVSIAYSGTPGVVGYIFVDGLQVASALDQPNSATVIVPDGSTYETTGSAGFITWAELR